MVNGMADGESRELGGESISVSPKHFVLWVLTPVNKGEFGVIVEGGCHFFVTRDQGPLLKSGDVGGKYPGESTAGGHF